MRVLVSCALLWVASPAIGQVVFEENAAGFGVGAFSSSVGMGSGVAAADMGDDGDVDLFVPNADGVPDQLYRNLGGGQLEEVAAALGVASTRPSRVAVWLDYNGDNRLDLLVGADCFMNAGTCAGLRTLTLHEQQADGSFADVSESAGLNGLLTLDEDQHLGGFAAGDLDGDGDLDVYVAEWSMAADRPDASILLRNNGNGSFSDVTAGSGLDGTSDGRWQPAMNDFNGDGLLDIFSAVDFEPNRLWINLGGLQFVDRAANTGFASAFNEMGTALGDPDNDGDIDVYNTNIDNLASTLIALGIPPEDIVLFPELTIRHNVFFQKRLVNGFPRFDEVAIQAGIASSFWGWGATFFDADRDGWQDLAATNGFTNPPFDNDPSVFFLNNAQAPLSFTDLSAESGFDDTYWGSALIAVDLDRDGDLDVVQTTVDGPLRVLQNTTANDNHWLVVRTRSQTPNRRAIGATVRVTAGGVSMTRPITAGISFLGQEPAEAFFGLGSATQAETIRIEWPDLSVTQLTEIPADQVLTVMQNGCGAQSRKCVCGDSNQDGALTAVDIAGAAMCANGVTPCDSSVVDTDGDNSTTALDIGGIVATLSGNASPEELRCSRNAAP